MKRFAVYPQIKTTATIVYANDFDDAFDKIHEYINRLSDDEFRAYISKVLNVNDCQIEPYDVETDENRFPADERCAVVIK